MTADELIHEWAKWHTEVQPPTGNIYANWQSESMARFVAEVVIPGEYKEGHDNGFRSGRERHERCD